MHREANSRRVSGHAVIADALIGATFGRRYRIDRLIGAGPTGRVYEAEHLHLHRRVALKILHRELAEDVDLRARFMREPLRAAATGHPHVIPVIDANAEDGRLYIVMELVEGTDLRNLLRESGPLEPGRALGLLSQVAAGLDAAHADGLVHRDIKPENILLGADGAVFLTDFGLARSTGRPGMPAYAAPEQCEGAVVDARSDLYSFACVVFECLTGNQPFARASGAETARAHLAEAPPPVASFRPSLPRALDDVMERALAKAPSLRFATAGDLVETVRAALGASEAVRAPRRAPVRPEPAGEARVHVTRARRRTPPGLGALIGIPAAVAIGLVAAFATHGKATAAPSPPVTHVKPPLVLRSSEVRVSVPADWSRRPLPAVIGRLGLRSAIAVAPAERSRGMVVVASSSAAALTPRLLTPELAQAARGRAGTRLRLGELEGLRYASLALTGLASDAVVYAIPADRRVLLVTCLPATQPAAAFLAACERIASTARPVQGRVVRVVSSTAYAAGLAAALAHLQTRAARAHARLAHARTRAAQATAAGAAAKAYGDAARALGRLDPLPQVTLLQRALIADVRAAAKGYAGLVRAARTGKGAAWSVSAHGVRTAETLTGRAAAALRAAVILPRTSA